MAVSAITFKGDKPEKLIIVEAFKDLCIKENWTQEECFTNLLQAQKQVSEIPTDIADLRRKAAVYDRVDHIRLTYGGEGTQTIDKSIDQAEKKLSEFFEAGGTPEQLRNAVKEEFSFDEEIENILPAKEASSEACKDCKLIPLMEIYVANEKKAHDAIYRFTQALHLEKPGVTPLTRDEGLEQFFQFTSTLPDA